MMKKLHTIITIVITAVLFWLGFGYLRYSLITEQVCDGYNWWEDEAECAAQFALDKNDPRYCRVNLFGETGDLCALIYAEQTTDADTCNKIDLLSAKNKCQQRFE